MLIYNYREGTRLFSSELNQLNLLHFLPVKLRMNRPNLETNSFLSKCNEYTTHTHSLITYSLTYYLLTHLLPTHSLTHLLTYSLTNSHTHSFTHSLTHSCIASSAVRISYISETSGSVGVVTGTTLFHLRLAC